MNQPIATMTVKSKEFGDTRLINACDFDEKLYEMVVEKEPTKTTAEATGKAAAQPVLSVVEKDGKFVVVNDKNEQQGDVQETAEAAEALIKLLSGK